MNFQTNSEYLNIGSQGYTQMVSPMKNIQFVNNKKKFFADNVHHKQSDFIFGSKMESAYGRDGKEARATAAQQPTAEKQTVKKLESHPIEQFWNEYKRQRQAVAADGQEPDAQSGINPEQVSPASGLDAVNVNGRAASQARKQQMLMGAAGVWNHSNQQNKGAAAGGVASKGLDDGSGKNVASQRVPSLPGQSTENQGEKSAGGGTQGSSNVPSNGQSHSYQQQLAQYEAELTQQLADQQAGLPRASQRPSAVVPPIEQQRLDAAPLDDYSQQLMEKYQGLGAPQDPSQMQTASFGGLPQVVASPDPSMQQQPLENGDMDYDMYGVPQGPSYFPDAAPGHFTPSTLSLEQSRYLQRMNNAALRQQECYKANLSRHANLSEKEKYAQRIEDRSHTDGAIYQGGGESTGYSPQSKVPLGKYVSQLEMKDPEARRRLKEMLEFQMKEKQDFGGRDPNRMKVRPIRQPGRPPIGQNQQRMLAPSSSAGMLPPLNQRNPALNFTQTMAPKPAGQGYLPVSQHQLHMHHGGAVHNQSPLRGSGHLQMNSQHASQAAGLVGQRFNDLKLGPGQNGNRGAGGGVTPGAIGGVPALRSYSSQPQLPPMTAPPLIMNQQQY